MPGLVFDRFDGVDLLPVYILGGRSVAQRRLIKMDNFSLSVMKRRPQILISHN